jgi:quinoprotein glucose dehydrogenase
MKFSFLRCQFLFVSLMVLVASCANPEEHIAPREVDTVKSAQFTEWTAYGGDNESSAFSLLDQINRTNVENLEVAWTYNTGDVRDDGRGTMECNPIIVDGVIYMTTPALKVIALDGTTGELIWSFDPYEGDAQARGVNRGVTYWEDGEEERILFTAGWTSKLYALNAETGEQIMSFGEEGIVDFNEGIQRENSGSVTATSPGVIYEDLFILGTRVGEGPKPAAPGDVCAYDVRTGTREWCFETIPGPGQFGNDTWGNESWKTAGGANAWGGLSVDRERGLVFLPLGSPSYIFYGGQRPGKNLFSNAVVAVDAETGERVWHFQTVHHDLWDAEPTAPPNLVTVRHDGELVDGVAQIGKRGDVFLLDRTSGEPLFPVEERPVPQSNLPGEQSWPTQPFPTKPEPYVRQGYTNSMLPIRSAEARQYAKEVLRNSRSEGMFTPPSREGTVMAPGFRGGSTWGGASFDPTTGILYVNATEVPGILKMVPTESDDSEETSRGESLYTSNCASCHGSDLTGNPPEYPSLVDLEARMSKGEVSEILDTGSGMMPPASNLSDEEKDAVIAFLFGDEQDQPITGKPEDIDPGSGGDLPYVHDGWQKFEAPDGYPAIKPPWGTLNAIDLNTGEIVWQKPLGEYEELIEKDLPPTGTDNLGGSMVTAGGLVFIGASKDEKFRAFDKHTGEILWETTLPAGGYATPSTYEVNGKQYIVIPAGGGGLLSTKPSDAVVAFALPE